MPFPRLTYERSAWSAYGVDKPDLRFGMELHDCRTRVRGTEFKMFAIGASPLEKRIVGFVDEGGAARSRREFDALVADAQGLGAKGLAWIALADGRREVVAAESGAHRSRSRTPSRRPAARAKDGDAVLLVADEPDAAHALAGQTAAARRRRAKGLRDPKRFAFCWVLDFPLFERDAGNRCADADPPSLHRAGARPRIARRRPARDARAALRRRAQRHGTRQRLDPHPRSGDAAQDLRPARLHRRRSPGPVRISARSASRTARRRTAASRSASTGSSRSWSVPIRSAKSSPFRRISASKTSWSTRRMTSNPRSCASSI